MFQSRFDETDLPLQIFFILILLILFAYNFAFLLEEGLS